MAGNTIINLSTVHTSDIKKHCAGERDSICSLLVARVGFSVDEEKAEDKQAIE